MEIAENIHLMVDAAIWGKLGFTPFPREQCTGDVPFGTLPIFMVLFVMLGLAAGVKTMLRSAQEIQDKKVAEEAENKSP